MAEVSEFGSIYTFAINDRAPNAFTEARLPYAVAIVELDEGVRLMANIVNAPLESIAIGKRLHVVCETAGEDISLPQIEPRIDHVLLTRECHAYQRRTEAARGSGRCRLYCCIARPVFRSRCFHLPAKAHSTCRAIPGRRGIG